MKKQMLMVILSGGGDTMISLVPFEAEAWIESPYPMSGEEAIPDAVKAGFEDQYDKSSGTVAVSSGSGDNDRALALCGYDFGSTTAAHQFAKKHDMEVAGEYHGCIY